MHQDAAQDKCESLKTAQLTPLALALHADSHPCRLAYKILSITSQQPHELMACCPRSRPWHPSCRIQVEGAHSVSRACGAAPGHEGRQPWCERGHFFDDEAASTEDRGAPPRCACTRAVMVGSAATAQCIVARGPLSGLGASTSSHTSAHGSGRQFPIGLVRLPRICDMSTVGCSTRRRLSGRQGTP